MYTGLMAEATGADGTYLHFMKITIRIADSSGNLLPPINVGNLGMNISPNDSSTATDWAQIFSELSNFLTTIGFAPISQLKNAASVNTSGCGSSSTGVGCDASAVWAQWTIPPPSPVFDKAINFRYQPNFPKPDIYSISVSTETDLWTTQYPGHFLTAATSSYSFQYVYESDGNSGNDAGMDFSTATAIALGSYNGFGYGADTADMYKFDGHAGQTIYYNLVAPQSADYGVSFYDPSWNPINGVGGDPGTGHTYYGSFTPSSTGSFFEKISLTSGSGTYSFALSTTPIPPDFTVSAGSSTVDGCPGGTTAGLVTFQSRNGFSGTISISESLSVSNSYVKPDLSPSSLTLSSSGSGSSGSVWAGLWSQDSDFSQGTYTVTVTGVSGSLTHQTGFSIIISYNYCSGKGGGGSVAYGTLISLADGSQAPVENLRIGMSLLSYDLSTGQYVVTTVTRFYSVATDNQMVITTGTGKPLIVDQNPAQELYVLLPDGHWTLLPVTSLRVGYNLYDALGQSWAPITSIQYQDNGQHIMYDVYTTTPGSYIANGYLDPQKT